jgi:hypothetical protein
MTRLCRFFLYDITFRPLLLAVLYTLLFSETIHAKELTSLQKTNLYVDEEQNRLDRIDGMIDGEITIDDSASTAQATKIYFRLVDSVQHIIDNATWDDNKKKIYRDQLYLQLKTIHPGNYLQLKRYEQLFAFIIGELKAIQQQKLYNYLINNIPLSFATFGFIKNELCADSFLIFSSAYKPDLVFKTYDSYYNKNYALRVLEETAKKAPVTVKRYFSKGNGIYETLLMSKDSCVKALIQIREKHTLKSNAYSLLDDIVNNRLTIDEANKLGESPEKYLRTMLQIRARPNPLGVHSLDSELEIFALKFVRVINDLHNEKDGVRFASIENFSADELYTLMVYSEEEIFTSTFNGLFKRLMVKLGPISGFEFLSRVGDNRFRTFIKMSAGFGKLGQFLQTMTALHQQMLMIKFASGLEKYNDLSQAVEVADAFGSITDSLILKILRGAIRYEYIRLNAKKDYRGTTIYGLLSNLFIERSISNANWFNSVAKQYALPSFDKIKSERLFAKDSINRWLIYFYDDEDGEVSFSTFLKTFTDPNWLVVDSGTYVIIKSKSGQRVHIYANKSKNEYDGQEALEKLFVENNFEPNVMVHRGHSYYAFKTVDKIRDNTQIFVLGSCGGYHSISGIIEKSQEVSIISSKQIGTMFVNNPMLKLMAGKIREGKDVEWQPLWEELYVLIKDNPKAYERYVDYIPPHKNLGAIFIKTYNSMMARE